MRHDYCRDDVNTFTRILSQSQPRHHYNTSSKQAPGIRGTCLELPTTNQLALTPIQNRCMPVAYTPHSRRNCENRSSCIGQYFRTGAALIAHAHIYERRGGGDTTKAASFPAGVRQTVHVCRRRRPDSLTAASLQTPKFANIVLPVEIAVSPAARDTCCWQTFCPRTTAAAATYTCTHISVHTRPDRKSMIVRARARVFIHMCAECVCSKVRERTSTSVRVSLTDNDPEGHDTIMGIKCAKRESVVCAALRRHRRRRRRRRRRGGLFLCCMHEELFNDSRAPARTHR